MSDFRQAQHALNGARTQLLKLAQEIGEGKRLGQDAETAMQMVAIGGEIGKAIAFLFAIDEISTRPTKSNEDQALIEAGNAIQRARGDDAMPRHSAASFASLKGYTSMVAFEADRIRGVIPPADGMFHGAPFWYEKTIDKAKRSAQ